MTTNDPTTPVLPLVTDDAWPPGIENMRDGFAGKLNVYRLMAHHPALLAAWENLRNHIVLHSALSPAQSEIVILRTARRHRSVYEWSHHLSRGRKVGLDAATIEACAAAAAPADAASETSLLIAAVDCLSDQGGIEPALRRLLTAKFGLPATMDVIATVGFYTTLAFLLGTFDVTLDANIAAELAQGDMPRLARLVLSP